LKRRDFGAKPGRVFAKTGTLKGVSALSGFVLDTENRPRWAFSLIGNAPRGTNGRLTVRQNQIMKLLVRKLDGEEAPLPERAPVKRRDRGLKVYVEHPS
jgi:D-alanyl-D-alanine carboxypeptidase